MEIKRAIAQSQVRKIDENSRKIEFIISTDDKDRHGTVLNMDNWSLKNYRANGIVGYQHDVYGSWSGDDNPDKVIGKGRVFIEENEGKKQLIGEVEFEGTESTGNELAEKIFKKVKFGSLKATSVGFTPLRDKEGKSGTFGRMGEDGKITEKDTFFYYGQELLEFSIVNIPSNPKAMKRGIENMNTEAIKSELKLRGFKDVEKMTIEEAERIIKSDEKPKESNTDTTNVFDYKLKLNQKRLLL
jgi:hypothetical protein